MQVVHRGLLESRSLGKHVSALISELPVLGLGGRVTAEVVPTEDSGIGSFEEEVFVEVPLLRMEEGNGVDLQGAGVRENAKAFRESLVQFGVVCTGGESAGWDVRDGIGI